MRKIGGYMKFVWGGDRAAINSELLFVFDAPKEADRLELYGADIYTVTAGKKIISFGPERCAAGYARRRSVKISGGEKIEVRVRAYGVTNYCVDFQKPYFAAEIYSGESLLLSADKLGFAYIEKRRLTSMPRYSAQRAFTEGYDLGETERIKVPLYEVEPPVLLDGAHDPCKYPAYTPEHLGREVFSGFDEIKPHRQSANRAEVPIGEFSVEEWIKKAVRLGYIQENLRLRTEKCGLLSFEISAETDGELVLFFEEICPDGKWIFRRAGNNDFVYIKYPAGKSNITVGEPFAVKEIRLVHADGARISPTLIGVENNKASCVGVQGDKRVERVFEAARNTFMQNATDIFMDCPGRERAGWLCDSYFTAIAERLFTGKNTIERAYLENYILAKTPEVAEGMLPMCFPGEHVNGRYIPNWAMWFVIELWDRQKRCGDTELVRLAREKVYGIYNFFERFKNEYGLLENLESWVFIEWSICNDDDHVCGVNYPSNMLYAFMLDKIADLYEDEKLHVEAENIRKCIVKLAFDGKFFVDNAIRENGVLVNCATHLSETCQYYALFMGLDCTEEFKEMMIRDFGPLRTDAYPEVGRSNMFIGNYLRFFWLLSLGERERTLHECLEYFDKMASSTGTLWEHDRATASCNHGFASVAAHIMLSALFGYETVKDGMPIFKKNTAPLEGYDVEVSFDY